VLAEGELVRLQGKTAPTSLLGCEAVARGQLTNQEPSRRDRGIGACVTGPWSVLHVGLHSTFAHASRHCIPATIVVRVGERSARIIRCLPMPSHYPVQMSSHRHYNRHRAGGSLILIAAL